MNNLPNFNLESYITLLDTLAQTYKFSQIKIIGDNVSNTVYLRHDVDFHLNGINKISTIENNLGIQSTYFILLSAQYNIWQSENRKILEILVSQGHEIGLHYDLKEYPVHDYEASEGNLQFEINILEKLLGIKVASIVMHQPHTGVHDIFKEHPLYIHPHNPIYQENMIYISDRCRAWRDETLLEIIQNKQKGNVQINLHPEVWLGNEVNRIDFLNDTLDKNLKAPIEELKKTIQNVWSTHSAAINHDKRNLRW